MNSPTALMETLSSLLGKVTGIKHDVFFKYSLDMSGRHRINISYDNPMLNPAKIRNIIVNSKIIETSEKMASCFYPMLVFVEPFDQSRESEPILILTQNNVCVVVQSDNSNFFGPADNEESFADWFFRLCSRENPFKNVEWHLVCAEQNVWSTNPDVSAKNYIFHTTFLKFKEIPKNDEVIFGYGGYGSGNWGFFLTLKKDNVLLEFRLLFGGAYSNDMEAEIDNIISHLKGVERFFLSETSFKSKIRMQYMDDFQCTLSIDGNKVELIDHERPTDGLTKWETVINKLGLK